MSCKTFPYSAREEKAYKGNPAIQLFGNRLFIDQTTMEFLVEFLLVVASEKKVGSDTDTFTTALPPRDVLSAWQNAELRYAPKARLNLKLFSFLGASRLDTRHATHRAQFARLVGELTSEKKMSVAGNSNREDVVRTIEALFLGFQGAGSGRTWCAQSFLPIAPGFLAGETIWKQSKARSNSPQSWDTVLAGLTTYFDMSQHVFLARGGELLYLQICNGLRQSPETIQRWVSESGLDLDSYEQSPKWLHRELESELRGLLMRPPKAISELAEFVDQGLEQETSELTDKTGYEPRFVSAGWCPDESWQEGYLLAVDLLRICKASLDVMERLRLLESALAMHVLRALMLQSGRYRKPGDMTAWPGYRLAVSAPEDKRTMIKRISHHTANFAEKQIFQAIRSNDIDQPQGEGQPEKSLKEADRRYAGKLFVGLAKRIGLLVPRRGRGMRFVLNERLLRMLVMTTVPLGDRLTFATFKRNVETRYGLVFDAAGFVRACEWAEYGTRVHLPNDTDAWLQNMLAAAGLLIELSDSCALVSNPSDSRT